VAAEGAGGLLNQQALNAQAKGLASSGQQAAVPHWREAVNQL